MSLSDMVGAYEALLGLSALSEDDVEGTRFDVGTTSVRLVRAGNPVQVLFSNPRDAKFFYDEMVERYKREQRRLHGD